MAWDRTKAKQVALLTGCVLAGASAATVGGPVGWAAAMVALSNLATECIKGLVPNILNDLLGEDRDAERVDAQMRQRGLQNADVHRLGGQAIALVLDQCAREFLGGSDGVKYLQNASKAVAKAWGKVALDARYETIANSEADRFFAASPAQVKKVTTLDDKLWHDLIADLAYYAGHEAHDGALKFAASRLRDRYSAAIWEVAKRAWKKDDLAWPALQLRLLSEIRGDTQAVAKADISLATSVASIETHLQLLTIAAHDQAEGIVRRLGTKLDANQVVLLRSIDDLSASLAQAFGASFNSLSDLHDKLDALAKDTALLPDMRGRLQNVQDRLTPKVPLQSVPKPSERNDTYVFSGRRIEMCGRDVEMDALRQFMTDPRRVLWWLWKGPAGIGKSRLALELCIEAVHGSRHGIGLWHAGFLDSRRDVPTDWTNVAFPRDTLVVVDYVSSKASKVHNWLYQLCETPPSPSAARLRFILLDREEYDVWTQQLLGDQRARDVIEIARYQDTRSVNSLSDDDLWSIMVDATAALDQPIDPARRDEVLQAMQSCNPGKRPLFAAFAAAALVEGKPIQQWAPQDLARYVLDHEEAEWKRQAAIRGVSPADLSKHKALLALATLAHGVDCGGNYDALVDEVTLSGAASMLPARGSFAGSWGLLDDMLSLTGHPCEDDILPLQPDYVGEFFVLEHVDKRITQPAMRCAFLRGAIAADEVDTAATLLRMMQNFPQHPGITALMNCVLPPGSIEGGPDDPLPPSPFSPAASWILDTTLATVSKNSGRTELAHRLFERSLEANHDEPVTLNNFAALLSKDPAQKERAAEMYERALRLRPDYAYALNNYAALLSTYPDQAGRAAEMYERALALRPDDAKTLYNYATLLSNQPDQWARAVNLYEQALTLRPDDAGTLTNFAALLSKDPAQTARAAQMCERALTLRPDDADTLNNFAALLSKDSAQRARASAMFERALSIRPNDADTLYNYATMLMKDPTQTIRVAQLYERALAVDPDHADSLNNYANLLSLDPAQAARSAELYERALSVNPDDAEALNNYANLLMKEPAHAARAAPMFERALSRRPDYADALYNYATLLSHQPAQWPRAAELYERALTLRPDDADALYNFATLLSHQPAQWTRAAELYERALTLRPDDVDAHNSFANLLSKNPARAVEAANLYARARRLDPAKPAVFLNFVTILAAGVDRESGLDLIRGTLRDGSVPGGGGGAIVLLYLLAGFGPMEEAGQALRTLRRILTDSKARPHGWSFDIPLVYLREDRHPDLQWLEKLAEVLLGKAQPDVLEGWTRWREAKALG